MNKEIIDLLVESNNTLLSLFEVDDDNKREKEVNKIKRERKDKDGNETEVVSVADELFPYKGTAKEQFNQKVIAKINDMIEGTATLQDLIQLVRQGKSIKESLNNNTILLEEIINEIDERTKINSYKKRVAQYKEISDKAKKYAQDEMNWGNYSAAIQQLEKAEKAQQKEFKHRLRTIIHDKKFGQDAFNKANKEMFDEWKDKNKKEIKENLDTNISLLEELILERNKDNKKKKEKWELKTNHITKKEKKAIQDYAKEQGNEAKFHQKAADDYDKIYSQQPAVSPNGMRNPVANYFKDKYREMLRNKGRNEQNIADEVEPLTKKLKNREHKFHDMIRGFHNPNLNH